MVPSNTKTEINMKVTGIKIFNKVWVHIITPIVISTRDNGEVENPTDRAITSTKVEKQYTKEIGRTVRNKGSDS